VAAWEEMADSLAVRTFGTVEVELVLRWDLDELTLRRWRVVYSR
jgi:hypothetical protein